VLTRSKTGSVSVTASLPVKGRLQVACAPQVGATTGDFIDGPFFKFIRTEDSIIDFTYRAVHFIAPS